MEENLKSIDGIIEKMALISDAVDNIFPDGKKVIVFELKLEDFKKVQNNFREIDRTHKQFKIDISGVEFIFLLDDLLDTSEDNS
jgi:hypothetical protein